MINYQSRMLDIDITTHISQFMQIKELINYILVSKSMFNIKKELICNHPDIKKFEELYGKYTFFTTLFYSTRTYPEFQRQSQQLHQQKNQNNSLIMQNTMKLITFEYLQNSKKDMLNEMISIFKENIKKDYRISRTNLKNTNELFEKLLKTYPNWNVTDINMYVLYQMIYLGFTNNFMEIFNIPDVSKGLIKDNKKEYKEIYFASVGMMLGFICEIKNYVIRSSVIYMLFKFIDVNTPFYATYKDKYRNFSDSIVNKLAYVLIQIKTSHHLPDEFKNICGDKLNVIYTNLKNNY